ncbi:MAG TPA: COX15/CtaA family protein [Phycisphaerales bacterium]|nr:COX15/CtaA family protein [Phycisphaerales bacterium]
MYGFASAVCVWTAWFVTHVPWVSLAEPVRVGVVLGVWLLVSLLAGRATGAARGLQVGALSGLIAAAVGLLLLGAKIIPPEGTQGATPVYLIVPGFLALGAVVGAIGGVIGGLSNRRPAAGDWLARFSIVTVMSAAPLLFVGGLVTTTNSGMAVPDWPRTFGMNMFLYPLGNANVDVFLEHSHRLFGTLVGLTALVLMVWTVRSEPRRWVKGFAIGVFAAIVVQGVLGGGRVLGNSVAAAIVHGVFAQIIFAGLVALAAMLWMTPERLAGVQPFERDRKVKALVTAALHSTILQVIFGAAYRHTREMKGATHALFAHIGFSFIVLVAALLGGMYAASIPATATGPVRVLRRLGQALVAAVSVQFLLGWAAWSMGGSGRVPELVSQSLLRTAHQANGAVLLGVATAAAVVAKMVYRAAHNPGERRCSRCGYVLAGLPEVTQCPECGQPT